MQRLLDTGAQPLLFKWFGDVIESSLLDGGHGIVNGTEGRNDNHGQLRCTLLDMGQDRHAVGIGQLEVGNHQVEAAGLESLYGLQAIFRLNEFQGQVAEQHGDYAPHADFVFNYQYVRSFFHYLYQGIEISA